jgi:hypothetical protein
MNKVFFSLTTEPHTHNQLKAVKQGNQAPTKTNPPTQPSKTKKQLQPHLQKLSSYSNSAEKQN